MKSQKCSKTEDKLIKKEEEKKLYCWKKTDFYFQIIGCIPGMPWSNIWSGLVNIPSAGVNNSQDMTCKTKDGPRECSLDVAADETSHTALYFSVHSHWLE